MLYKVGDKVKIKKREELINCESVVNLEAMLRFAGCTMTIKEVFEDAYYLLEDENEFYWSEDCFAEFSIKELRELPINQVDEKLEHLRQTVDDLLIEFREFKNRVLELEKCYIFCDAIVPCTNYVDEKLEECVVGIGPHGEEFTNTKTICNYIPASDIKTEPMFDILHERIDKLEKRIEELERKVDLVETLTMRLFLLHVLMKTTK